MDAEGRNRRYDQVRRCLAEAERAFARAGAVEDERERQRLIEEAEGWLIRAERRLARLTDRPLALSRPDRLEGERRSFDDLRSAHSSLVWRRQPKA